MGVQSAEPEERQDCHHDHDQTDQIDDGVHAKPPQTRAFPPNVHVLVKVAPPEHLPHGGVEPQFGEAQE